MLITRTKKNNNNNPNTSNTGFSSKLKANGLGKYKYPTYDEVPSGWYVSEIMDVKESTTKSGKPTIEVFYKIEDESQCYKRVNGLLEENYKEKKHYIKQSYPEGTQFRDDFVDSMAETLGKDEFDLEEIKGLTERIGISYNDYSTIGGIDDRCYIEPEDYIDDRYVSDATEVDKIAEDEESDELYL